MAGFEPLLKIALLACAALFGACTGRFVGKLTRGARSSQIYFATELVMALAFALIAWEYGPSIQTLAYFILTSLLLAILFVDIDSMMIPNGFILAGIALWVLSVWFIKPPLEGIGVGSLFTSLVGYSFLATLIDGLVGAFTISGGVLIFAMLFDRLTGKDSLGGGDVKLFFMVGLYLGLVASIFNLLLSCFLGLIFSLIWTKFVRSQSKERVFPFGPAIAVSTVISLLMGYTF